MIKTYALIIVLFSVISANSQDNFLVLKKRHKPIQHFWTGARITFQQENSDWLRGIITRITPDSFYFTQEIIRFNGSGYDSMHFSGMRFAIKDVAVMPTRKQITYYSEDRVKVIYGHEKYVWIKNGFLFQVAGAGYATLNITNHLIDNDPLFAKRNLPGLGIAAGLFLLGRFLHLKHDPFIHIGKKYRLEVVLLETGKKPF